MLSPHANFPACCYRSYCFFDTPAAVQADVKRAITTRTGNMLCSVTNQLQYTAQAEQYAFAIVSIDNANNYARSSIYQLRTTSASSAAQAPKLRLGLTLLLLAVVPLLL